MDETRWAGIFSIFIGVLICAWQIHEVTSGSSFTVWTLGFIPLPVIVLGIIFVLGGLVALVKVLTSIGIISIVLFVAIYGVELFSHGGRPVTIQWIQENFGKTGLIVLNILIVIAFLALLPYRRSTQGTWKSKGVFIAFVIALMTEMFGWPLLIFLISPLVEVPSLRAWAHQTLGHVGPILGTWVSMIGLLLIALGWRQIHRAQGLVTTGLYRFIRHPQYTGIFLFTFGWILHWPSVITLIIWPILVAAYVWLALREEVFVTEEFGEAYRQYAQKTPRFFPRLFSMKSRNRVS